VQILEAGKEAAMISILLLILLVVLLVIALPAWPYSESWGYYPSATLTVMFVILMTLMLLGHI
jgi:Protein of unknown function (DUF3309)